MGRTVGVFVGIPGSETFLHVDAELVALLFELIGTTIKSST